jgi:hypothetical protein
VRFAPHERREAHLSIEINTAGKHPLLADFRHVSTPEGVRMGAPGPDWSRLLLDGTRPARLRDCVDGGGLALLDEITASIANSGYPILFGGTPNPVWTGRGPAAWPGVEATRDEVNVALGRADIEAGGPRDWAGIVYRITEGEVRTIVVLGRSADPAAPHTTIQTTWRLLSGAAYAPTWAPVALERCVQRHDGDGFRTIFKSVEAIVDPELFVLDHNRRLPPHDAGWGQPSRLNLERSTPPARLTLVKAELGNEDQGWKAWVVKLAPHDCPFTTADALCWPRHLPLIDVAMAISDALHAYADDKHGLLTARLEPPPDDADGALWCAIAYLRACADDTLRFRPSERRGFNRVADDLTARKHYTRPDRAGLQ